MIWDLFCRVVDNFGDIGVCWRLAADLASRGERVRLWVDDASALAWMAPGGAVGVTVLNWNADKPDGAVGDVVVEAFGCDPPAVFVQSMARRTVAPVWINLEYLSAEPAAERNHCLMSPQLSGPGKGLSKWFFYPGFTRRTGGLIRETGLLDALQHFDADDWLRGHGLVRRDGERIVSLFCYPNQRVPDLLDSLAATPTLLLATSGLATQQVLHILGPTATRGALRAVALPLLTQNDFDRLLWASDLNFVRGEDSFVRAQWAGKPFVWHIYPQHDGAHEAKLNAFTDRFLSGADATLASDVRNLWRNWNGLSDQPIGTIELEPWRRHCLAWRAGLLTQPDLARQLLSFVAERR
jgi:uncharacterized repeat protein (TIGR03837 family)